jgi:hypothetical protein
MAGVCVLAVIVGTPQREPAGRVVRARPLAVHPVDRLREPPAPLATPESYPWSDRPRLTTDLERHVADLHRQAIVLRHGLRNGAGPAPREMLAAIRDAEGRVVVELARMNVATENSWPGVRRDLLAAVMHLGRTVERARRAASPGSAVLTI